MSHFTMMKSGSAKERGMRRRFESRQEPYLSDLTNHDEPGEKARRVLFETSRRHSASVRRLRLAILAISAVFIILVGGLIVFNPLKHLPKNISIGEVQIDGTKVVVDKPKIAGLQQNGLPFEITARSGTEDILKPNILKLSGVRAKITLADLSQLEVLAKDGIYDNQLDQVLIEGDVHIKNNGNYLIEMNQASLDFKTNVLYSNQFAFMQLTNGKITSDTITISKNGERIEFEGRVKSIFEEVSVGAEQE